MSSLTNSAARNSAATALEFLAFTLGAEEYGVDIQKIQELRGYDPVTRIANAPDCIKGVVNLRGVIVPIVDLRIKFGLGTPRYDQFTVVIILNVCGKVMGIVVDSVSDVTSLEPDQIKSPPQLGTGPEPGHLVGLGTLGERILILLDIDRLLAGAELAAS